MRWMEYLSRFDFDITYIKGITNRVADVLSRYYESDTAGEHHSPSNYVNADVRIDKLGEDLPIGRADEVAQILEQFRAQREAKDAIEPRDLEAQELEAAREPDLVEPYPALFDNPTVIKSRAKGPDLRAMVATGDAILSDFKTGYSKDPLLSKVIDNIEDYPRFSIKDELVWTTNLADEPVLTRLSDTSVHNVLPTTSVGGTGGREYME
ncbi:hypothetical protein PM082_024909 [Marasmius tenuissimus]|nr:hypothetical protein PM082_024909 [Marasmius tenuissimus]